MSQTDYLYWDKKQNCFKSKSLVRKPHGYCVHEYVNENGSFTKIELFAMFERNLLNAIKQRLKALPEFTGFRPAYFGRRGKYILEEKSVIYWKKSPVLVRVYAQSKTGHVKVEVTRAVTKDSKKYYGRKFLAPKPTLNSLGELMKLLSNNEEPLHNKTHSSFLFVDEFLDACEEHFMKTALHGQLRDFRKTKLRNEIKFGFKRKRKPRI